MEKEFNANSESIQFTRKQNKTLSKSTFSRITRKNSRMEE